MALHVCENIIEDFSVIINKLLSKRFPIIIFDPNKSFLHNILQMNYSAQTAVSNTVIKYKSECPIGISYYDDFEFCSIV